MFHLRKILTYIEYKDVPKSVILFGLGGFVWKE